MVGLAPIAATVVHSTLVIPLILALQPAPAGIAQQVYQVSGQVSDVDRTGRMITISTGGTLHAPIYAGPELPIFDELRTGDIVTIAFYDAYIVAVTPGATMKPMENTTEAAKQKLDRANADVMQQTRLVVTIDAIDAQKGLVTYHGFDNRRVFRAVQHRQLLEGLKVGDVVTITFTRARAASIQRAQQQR